MTAQINFPRYIFVHLFVLYSSRVDASLDVIALVAQLLQISLFQLGGAFFFFLEIDYPAVAERLASSIIEKAS